jgi:hypothetical protein
VHLLTCKEVEDENDDENENDWGSGGGEPSIAGIVCLKAIDQSGQHCYKTRDYFLTGFLLASFLPKSSSSSFSSSAFGFTQTESGWGALRAPLRTSAPMWNLGRRCGRFWHFEAQLGGAAQAHEAQ